MKKFLCLFFLCFIFYVQTIPFSENYGRKVYWSDMSDREKITAVVEHSSIMSALSFLSAAFYGNYDFCKKLLMNGIRTDLTISCGGDFFSMADLIRGCLLEAEAERDAQMHLVHSLETSGYPYQPLYQDHAMVYDSIATVCDSLREIYTMLSPSTFDYYDCGVNNEDCVAVTEFLIALYETRPLRDFSRFLSEKRYITITVDGITFFLSDFADYIATVHRYIVFSAKKAEAVLGATLSDPRCYGIYRKRIDMHRMAAGSAESNKLFIESIL